MAEAKSVGISTAAGIGGSIMVLASALSYFVPTLNDYNDDQKVISEKFVESDKEHTKLDFRVQLNTMRLDGAFGQVPPAMRTPPTQPSAILDSPIDDSLVYAAEEPTTGLVAQNQERLEQYKKSMQRRPVLPVGFIRHCRLRPYTGGYFLLGKDGKSYSADDVIACILRDMGY